MIQQGFNSILNSILTAGSLRGFATQQREERLNQKKVTREETKLQELEKSEKAETLRLRQEIDKLPPEKKLSIEKTHGKVDEMSLASLQRVAQSEGIKAEPVKEPSIAAQAQEQIEESVEKGEDFDPRVLGPDMQRILYDVRSKRKWSDAKRMMDAYYELASAESLAAKEEGRLERRISLKQIRERANQNLEARRAKRKKGGSNQ